MPPLKWANKEQVGWLEARIPDFRAHQADRNVPKFWPCVYNAWFAQFPEWDAVFGDDPPTLPLTQEQQDRYGAAILKRRQRIYNWFNNYQGDHGRKAMQIRPLTTYMVDTCLKPRGQRILQLSEYYSQAFYRDKLREDVNAEVASCLVRGEKPCRISIAKRLAREGFENESDEVKQQIIAQRDQDMEFNVSLKGKSKDSNTFEASPTPESYQRCIDDMPTIVRQLITELARRTGWCFTVWAGGPQPSNGGTVESITMHSGSGEAGHDFGQANPLLKKIAIKPYLAFLKSVYPKRVCDARALQRTQGRSHPAQASENAIASSSQAPTPIVAETTSGLDFSNIPSVNVAMLPNVPSDIPSVNVTALPEVLLPAPLLSASSDVQPFNSSNVTLNGLPSVNGSLIPTSTPFSYGMQSIGENISDASIASGPPALGFPRLSGTPILDEPAFAMPYSSSHTAMSSDVFESQGSSTLTSSASTFPAHFDLTQFGFPFTDPNMFMLPSSTDDLTLLFDDIPDSDAMSIHSDIDSGYSSNFDGLDECLSLFDAADVLSNDYVLQDTSNNLVNGNNPAEEDPSTHMIGPEIVHSEHHLTEAGRPRRTRKPPRRADEDVSLASASRSSRKRQTADKENEPLAKGKRLSEGIPYSLWTLFSLTKVEGRGSRCNRHTCEEAGIVSELTDPIEREWDGDGRVISHEAHQEV
ncbi:hypothetical protein CERSUDRAFT_123247 [Gelatoporia subvermispora B]|uniref:Uncharacterized protein n=1 Tax=Ceriporiopsis subvermispora (strain B) TaxID=914234 RepID=M2QJM3_CERS8|nr:hypothetical protein CERSUDRAFT_123247 [Gelatoporia subvermispora B]